MKKWADHCIFKKKLNDERTRIIAVMACKDLGDGFGSAERWWKKEVVSSIERGISFITIIQGKDGKYNKGEDVHVVEVHGEKFIRTDANRTESDNLGELPEF